MEYALIGNRIIISDFTEFNIKHILECGQVFRFKKLDYGYVVYSLNHKANIYCQKSETIIECDDVKYFINYFDLDENYAKIKLELSTDSHLTEPIKYGYGIRILKQDPIETIISFIISANNNIPRIKKIIEDICENYGTKCDDYYAFPTLQQLSLIPKEFFTNIRAGYRDAYLYNTIQQLKNGFDLSIVNEMNSLEASKYLQQLSGVGSKVADCILLFGFAKTDIFPTDTWIKKVYADFNKDADVNKIAPIQIRNFFINKYGRNAGYAQQYLFYAKRDK